RLFRVKRTTRCVSARSFDARGQLVEPRVTGPERECCANLALCLDEVPGGGVRARELEPHVRARPPRGVLGCERDRLVEVLRPTAIDEQRDESEAVTDAMLRELVADQPLGLRTQRLRRVAGDRRGANLIHQVPQLATVDEGLLEQRACL